MIVIREFVDLDGRSPFSRWFNRLNARAAARVATALVRLVQGNLSGAKGVRAGIFEHRIDFGPSYRIYFGREGDSLISLLSSGPKSRQRRDVETARGHRREYKRRKRRESGEL